MATRKTVLTCRACRKQTSITVGTVMQRTHTEDVSMFEDHEYLKTLWFVLVASGLYAACCSANHPGWSTPSWPA
jgi:hypothetical protein